ncbi:hypothetical protein N9A45_00990 [bacterium]|nr:hypothetical protein [bacterium]
MYRSNYKSLFRCHTLVECMNYALVPNIKKADLFLYLLDTYDILLSHADGSMIVDENDDVPYVRLAEKLELYVFEAWESLLGRIPGQLKGWCEGMFVYTCICLCRWLASKPGCTVIPSETRDWMRKHALRSHASYDTASFSVADLLNALDIFEQRWRGLPELNHHVMIYLNALEFRAAWLVSHTAPATLFDIRTRRVSLSDDMFQIHPGMVYEFYARFMLIRRSFAQYTMWDTVPPVKQMPESRWQDFVDKENRHLSIRKFRDRVQGVTWDNLCRLSEPARASYNARGSRISSYQALAENRPLSILDKLNTQTSYGKKEGLHAHSMIKEGLHLQMIHAHFMSTYSVSFKNYFFCSYEKSWTHRTKLSHMVVPIIIERRRRYDVMHKGLVHLVPNGTVAEAFQLWLLFVRRDYRGILYGSMDFGRLCRFVFDPPEVAQQRNLGEGLTAYQWAV